MSAGQKAGHVANRSHESAEPDDRIAEAVQSLKSQAAADLSRLQEAYNRSWFDEFCELVERASGGMERLTQRRVRTAGWAKAGQESKPEAAPSCPDHPAEAKPSFRKAKPRGRKPKADFNRTVARIAKGFGDDWSTEAQLERFCEAADGQTVPLPVSNKWNKSGCTTWMDVFDEDRGGLVKAVQHRLDWVSKHPEES